VCLDDVEVSEGARTILDAIGCEVGTRTGKKLRRSDVAEWVIRCTDVDKVTLAFIEAQSRSFVPADGGCRPAKPGKAS